MTRTRTRTASEPAPLFRLPPIPSPIRARDRHTPGEVSSKRYAANTRADLEHRARMAEDARTPYALEVAGAMARAVRSIPRRPGERLTRAPWLELEGELERLRDRAEVDSANE